MEKNKKGKFIDQPLQLIENRRGRTLKQQSLLEELVRRGRVDSELLESNGLDFTEKENQVFDALLFFWSMSKLDEDSTFRFTPQELYEIVGCSSSTEKTRALDALIQLEYKVRLIAYKTKIIPGRKKVLEKATPYYVRTRCIHIAGFELDMEYVGRAPFDGECKNLRYKLRKAHAIDVRFDPHIEKHMRIRTYFCRTFVDLGKRLRDLGVKTNAFNGVRNLYYFICEQAVRSSFKSNKYTFKYGTIVHLSLIHI